MMIIITSDGGGWPLPHFLSEYCKHIYTQMQQRTDQGPVYCGQKMNYCFITRITSGDSEGCDLAVNTQHCPNIGPSFLTNNAAGTIWGALVSSIYYRQIGAHKIREITHNTSPYLTLSCILVVVVRTFRFPPWAQFAISLPIHPRKGRGDMSCELMEHAEIITREEPMSYSMSRLQPPHCRSR